jgi:tetratricopeptide (TPR) repeat protein
MQGVGKMNNIYKIFTIIFLFSSLSYSQSAEELFNLGCAEFQKQNYLGAIELFNKCIEKDSNATPAYFFRGESNLNLHNPERAFMDFQKSLELQPESNESVIYSRMASCKNQMQDFEGGLEYINKGLTYNPKDTVLLFSRGVQYFMMKKFDLAIKDCTDLIELNPSKLDAYCLKAVCEFNLKRYDEAFQDVDKAIYIDPDYYQAYQNKAEFYFQLKNWEKALESINKALQINQDNGHCFHIRAEVYFNTGEMDKCIKDFDKAIELNDIMELPYIYLDRGIAKISIGHREEGCTDIKKSVILGNSAAVIKFNELCNQK